MSWQYETCESCRYVGGVWCRRFPPNVSGEGVVTVFAYPLVYGVVEENLIPTQWQDACAEHAAREDER